MAKTITTPYDTVDYLKTEEDIARYFAACMEEAGDDAAYIAHVLGDIARARGMTQLAKACAGSSMASHTLSTSVLIQTSATHWPAIHPMG